MVRSAGHPDAQTLRLRLIVPAHESQNLVHRRKATPHEGVTKIENPRFAVARRLSAALTFA
jgi:hypothetical protein